MNRFLQSTVVSLAALLSVSTFVAIEAVRTVGPVLAQAAPPAGGGHGQRFGQMLMTLNLSDAQKGQIRGIIASARQQNQSVSDPQTKRSNMRAAYAKVRDILTPAQRAKLESEMAAAKAQRQSTDHS
jgi:Spy/CpxP family protein refolding chaperone